MTETALLANELRSGCTLVVVARKSEDNTEHREIFSENFRANGVTRFTVKRIIRMKVLIW